MKLHVSTQEEERLLTLQEAADFVGCHYQTLYRRVRSGEVPAAVAAGSYRIRATDLESWMQRRSSTTGAVPSRGRRDWRQLTEQYMTALLAGETDETRRLTERLIDGGVSAAEFCDNLFGPAMQGIGRLWHDGEITIADEHRASRTVEALLERVVTRSRRPGPRRGSVVIAAPAGDRNSLAPMMVAAGLRADGFTVHYLGSDLPVDEIAAMARREDADLICLSLSIDDSETLRAALATLVAEGRPVIVGGSGASRQDALDAGASGFGASVAEAQTLARDLVRARGSAAG